MSFGDKFRKNRLFDYGKMYAKDYGAHKFHLNEGTIIKAHYFSLGQ